MYNLNLTDHLVNTTAASISGVGNVRDGIPGHRTELDHHKHQGQHVLLPPECRAQGEDEGDDHHDGGDQPRLGEHVFQLLNRAH